MGVAVADRLGGRPAGSGPSQHRHRQRQRTDQREQCDRPSNHRDKLMGKPVHTDPSVARRSGPRRTARGRAGALALAFGPQSREPAGGSDRRAAQAAPSVAGSAASSPTSSGSPPRSEASTGTPAASASSTEYGHGSSQRDGASTTAARRRRSASVEGSSRPAKRTSAPLAVASPRRRGSSGPAPAITSGAPAALAAAIAVSYPFSSVRRPAASANSPSPARELTRSS